MGLAASGMTDSSNAAKVAAGLQGGYNAKSAEIASSAMDQANRLRQTVAENRSQLVGQLNGNESAFQAGRDAMSKANNLSNSINTSMLPGIVSGFAGAYGAAEEGRRYSTDGKGRGGGGMFGFGGVL